MGGREERLTPAPPLREPRVGERLVFDVYWMGIPVGTGSVQVLRKVRFRGRPAYRLAAIAKGNDFLSTLYPIRDRIVSLVDAERLCSLGFRKKVQEGHYRAHERIVYDPAAGKGSYESYTNGGKREFPVGPDVQDLLSALYWFRAQPAPVGSSSATRVHEEDKSYDLVFEVQRVEQKELLGGRVIPALVVEIKTRVQGILRKRGRMWCYFTLDERRVPIWVAIRTPYGPVVGVLREEPRVPALI